jgi:hypothetical protein
VSVEDNQKLRLNSPLGTLLLLPLISYIIQPSLGLPDLPTKARLIILVIRIYYMFIRIDIRI